MRCWLAVLLGGAHIFLQAHVVVGSLSCRWRTEGPIFSLSAGGNFLFLEATQAIHNRAVLFLETRRRLLLQLGKKERDGT